MVGEGIGGSFLTFLVELEAGRRLPIGGSGCSARNETDDDEASEFARPRIWAKERLNDDVVDSDDADGGEGSPGTTGGNSGEIGEGERGKAVEDFLCFAGLEGPWLVLEGGEGNGCIGAGEADGGKVRVREEGD